MSEIGQSIYWVLINNANILKLVIDSSEFRGIGTTDLYNNIRGRLYPYQEALNSQGGRNDVDLDSYENQQHDLSDELIMNMQCIPT